MSIAIRRYEDRDAPGVDRLNERLAAADTWHRVYKEDLTENPDADLAVRPINDSLYVAADDGEIRGGSWLREQYYWVEGGRHPVGWMKYPVSESLIDPSFAGVPAGMVFQFLRRQPRLLALGMGGHDAPFARLLAGIGWSSATIPMFFKITRPFRVLRGLNYLKRRWWLSIAAQVAAWSGIGWLGHRLLRATAHRPGKDVTGVVEDRFSPWADDVWEECRSAYPVTAVRNGKALDFLYPSSFPDLTRLRVTRAGSDIGWLALQIVPRSRNFGRYFGSLRVGLIADALCSPADAADLLTVGAKHLGTLGVDLVIAYFSHAVWIDAARRLRFLSGPSNFAFYMSPEAESLFLSSHDLSERCHFTRHTFGEDGLPEGSPSLASTT
jgi:hypothetical protein